MAEDTEDTQIQHGDIIYCIGFRMRMEGISICNVEICRQPLGGSPGQTKAREEEEQEQAEGGAGGRQGAGGEGRGKGAAGRPPHL